MGGGAGLGATGLREAPADDRARDESDERHHLRTCVCVSTACSPAQTRRQRGSQQAGGMGDYKRALCGVSAASGLCVMHRLQVVCVCCVPARLQSRVRLREPAGVRAVGVAGGGEGPEHPGVVGRREQVACAPQRAHPRQSRATLVSRDPRQSGDRERVLGLLDALLCLQNYLRSG